MKTAIYCRVSTEGQEQDKASLETQLDGYFKLIEAKIYDHWTNIKMFAIPCVCYGIVILNRL
jgi:DNA invertase Pin-like site-specific DNA recombinase